ncbi:MAG: toll/interleukin-1 receptor domain-containing protein [Bryobacter sp.]|nr:toll/interleukin-1 receptor domain-containing protein [Bryobacter sp.]
MRSSEAEAARRRLVRVVRECIAGGAVVDIDGLGRFEPDAKRGVRFVAARRPRIFIAYVTEDARRAERLYDEFRRRGYDPWLDRRRLLPGQNWPRAIEEAIEVADYAVLCLSRQAVRKRGQFQAEIRYALDCALAVPLGRAYLLPVRLDDCEVPPRIQKQVQYVDLFPRFQRGVERLIEAIERQQDKLRAA